MKLSEIFSGISCITTADMDTQITVLTDDSRKAQPGSVFFCIKGLTRDGHEFAPGAAQAGAIVVCERDLGLHEHQIIVEDSRLAYAAACENYFGNPLRRLKLIGITGTNGKTSTTFILKHILEQCGKKTGLIGTVQNMIGDEVVEAHYTTPFTYELHELFGRMADAGCEYCVMEVSSFGLEQGRVAGLHFEVACFTNLSQDHIDVHHTMEAYFDAKCILFERCDKAVINADDPWSHKIPLSDDVSTLWFSQKGNEGLTASDILCRADGVDFTMSLNGSEAERVSVGIPGRFSVYNLLSAAGCALAAGLELSDIAAALRTAKGVKGRAEVYPNGKDYTIIIDYAHSPDGVENILRSMRELTRGRLVALLGCGGDRDAAKRPLMGEAAARLADFVIVTSDNPRSEDPESIISQIVPGVEKHSTGHVVIVNRRDAIEYAVRNARKADVIVLAGKGHETYQILSTGTIHFDEREVLDEIYAKIAAEEGQSNG